MNRILRSHGTAGSLGAKPRNASTWQRANACLEALERDEEGNRLGEEEEVARTEFLEEDRITPGQERKMAKNCPFSSGALVVAGRHVVRCLCLWNSSYRTCLEQVEKRESSGQRESPDLETQSYPGGNSALRLLVFAKDFSERVRV